MFSSKHSSCTTILVGKKASYDGSTIIARNEDAGEAVHPKKFVVVESEDQPRDYHSKLTNFAVKLPENIEIYLSADAVPGEGIWGEAGINAHNVAMSATETITTNARVIGADPFEKDGLGEEDLLTITLPYINSAREGVQRLVSCLRSMALMNLTGFCSQTSMKFGTWKLPAAITGCSADSR